MCLHVAVMLSEVKFVTDSLKLKAKRAVVLVGIELVEEIPVLRLALETSMVTFEAFHFQPEVDLGELM